MASQLLQQQRGSLHGVPQARWQAEVGGAMHLAPSSLPLPLGWVGRVSQACRPGPHSPQPEGAGGRDSAHHQVSCLPQRQLQHFEQSAVWRKLQVSGAVWRGCWAVHPWGFPTQKDLRGLLEVRKLHCPLQHPLLREGWHWAGDVACGKAQQARSGYAGLGRRLR